MLTPVTISLGLSGFYTPNEPQTGFQIVLNTTPGLGGTTSNLLNIFDGETIPVSITSNMMVSSFAPYFDFSTFVSARAYDSVPLIPGAGVPGPDAVANFENTARLSITLPSSAFSFTSESTVLLTQASTPTAVPEPSSLLLLGCGLVGLAARLKRVA